MHTEIACFLLVFLADLSQGRSQISLNNEEIPVNGFVPVEDIGGTADAALLCTTGGTAGSWLYPNGTVVPTTTGQLLWTSHQNGVVRLHRSPQPFERNATGLYRCQYSLSGVELTLHVGIYHRDNAGSLRIPNGIEFTIESDLCADPPVFSLSCDSSWGPVTNMTWTYNGSLVSEGWEQSSRVVSTTESRYQNMLTVRGRFTGQYRCTLTNNQEQSTASAVLNVQGPPTPMDVFVTQTNLTTLEVTWIQQWSHDISHQRVYVESKGIERSLDTDGDVRSLRLTDLQSECSFSVSVQALSNQLPSPVSAPVTVFLEDTLAPSPPINISLTSNSATSLTVTWEQSDTDVVDSYQITYSYTGPCEEYEHRGTIERIAMATREYTVRGLQEYSQYEIQVTAVSEAGRAGSSATGSTLSGTPGAPTIHSAVSSNSTFGSIDVTWSHTPCIHRNSEIQAYNIRIEFSAYSWVSSNFRYYSPLQFINVTFPLWTLMTDSVVRHTLTGLVITAEYRVSVAGMTSQGVIGHYSPSVSANASHPQVFGFMFRGQLLPNNSAVSLEDIGLDDAALLCLTENTRTLIGTKTGEWYYPDGSQVNPRGYDDTLFRNRGDGIVLLQQRDNYNYNYYYYYYFNSRYYESEMEGRHRCEIPGNNRELQTLYIELYSPQSYDVVIERGINFQLESQLFDNPPSFTLACSLSGGLPTGVQWRINGEPVELFSQDVTALQAGASYSLKVRNRTEGLYEFSIDKGARNSSELRQLLVEAPDTPANFQAHQLEMNSIKATWTPVTKATGYHVRLMKDNQTMSIQYVGGNSTELTLTGLRVEQVYSVSMVAVLKYLPSVRTETVRVVLKQAPSVLVEVESLSPRAVVGEPLSLTCTLSSSEPLISRNVTMQWLNRTSPVGGRVGNEYIVKSVISMDSLTHTLIIRELGTYHAGLYRCSVIIDNVLFEESYEIASITNATFLSNETHADCSLVARGTSSVAGLVVIGSWQHLSMSDQCLNESVISNGACGASFTAVIGLSPPLVTADRWYRCSLLLTQSTITQTCLDVADTATLTQTQINNSTSFSLSWEPLPCSSDHGVTVGYRIHYSTILPLSKNPQIGQTLGGTFIELTGDPFTRYFAQVAAVGENGTTGTYLPPTSVFLPAEGVGLMLSRVSLQNHSIVNLDRIGYNSTHPLLCVTDSASCCDSAGNARWLFPNGTEVRSFDSRNVSGQARGASSVGLYQSTQDPLPEGVYLCEVPDREGRLQRLFVGLYHRDTIFQPILRAVEDRAPRIGEEHHLVCDTTVNTEVHEISSVTWLHQRREIGAGSITTLPINGSNFHRVTSTLSLSPVQATHGGEYTCRVQLSNDQRVHEQTINVTVQVSSPTITITSNHSGRLYEGAVVELTCLIHYDSSVDDSLLAVGVRWMGLNGRLTQASSASLSSEPQLWKSSVIIHQLSVNESGPVNCTVDTRISQSNTFLIPAEQITGSLMITIAQILPPSGPPVNFSSANQQSHTVTFSWEPPPQERQRGPIVGYSIECCASDSDYSARNDCVRETAVLKSPFTMAQFAPNTVYSCTMVARTRAGGSPAAVVAVTTRADAHFPNTVERCVQLQSVGAQSCDGGGKREALRNIIDDVIRFNSSHCTSRHGCHKNRTFHEIKNAGFVCDTNLEILGFQGVLGSRGSGVRAMDLAETLRQWAIRGPAVNVAGLFMTIEPSCPVVISSLGEIECYLATVSQDQRCVQVAAASGGVIGGFVTILILAAITCLVLLYYRRKQKITRYDISSRVELKPEEGSSQLSKARDEEVMDTELYIEASTDNSSSPKDEYDYISVGALRYQVPVSIAKKRLEPAGGGGKEAAATEEEEYMRMTELTEPKTEEKKEIQSLKGKSKKKSKGYENVILSGPSMSEPQESQRENEEEPIYDDVTQ